MKVFPPYTLLSFTCLTGLILTPTVWAKDHKPDSGHRKPGFIRSMDMNQDGEITQKEYKKAQINRFKRKDKTGDGYLTEEDRKVWKKKVRKHKKAMEEKRKAWIEKADKNKDGKLSQSEFVAAQPRFSELDQNNDKKLSKEEIRAYMHKKHAHMKHHEGNH